MPVADKQTATSILMRNHATMHPHKWWRKPHALSFHDEEVTVANGSADTPSLLSLVCSCRQGFCQALLYPKP